MPFNTSGDCCTSSLCSTVFNWPFLLSLLEDNEVEAIVLFVWAMLENALDEKEPCDKALDEKVQTKSAVNTVVKYTLFVLVFNENFISSKSLTDKKETKPSNHLQLISLNQLGLSLGSYIV